jgi:PAS domain S-box-containing protein
MTRTPLARYVVAAAVVLLTFAAKEPIERLVGPGPPLIFFVPAVTISAWQGGLGPGLLATAVSSALCAYHYFPPIGSLAIANPNDVARLVAFVFESILTSILMEWLHLARRQAEESRRTANEFREVSRRTDERFRAIIDNTDALIFMKNLRLEYDVMNRKLREIVGVAEGKVVGLSDHDVFPKEVAEAIQANDRSVLQVGKAMQFEQVIPVGDGWHTYVSLKFPLLDSAGLPYALGGVSTDITLLKEAQRRAVQAERLAAIGQMAAGLAHEGRNALQRSQICLELLTRQLGDRPEAIDLVAGLQQAQDDLHRLYEEVRGYAAPIVLDLAGSATWCARRGDASSRAGRGATPCSENEETRTWLAPATRSG